jgi:hypothetical protein
MLMPTLASTTCSSMTAKPGLIVGAACRGHTAEEILPAGAPAPRGRSTYYRAALLGAFELPDEVAGWALEMAHPWPS